MAVDCSFAKSLPPKMRLFFLRSLSCQTIGLLELLANLTPIITMEERTKTMQHVNQIKHELKSSLRILILCHQIIFSAFHQHNLTRKPKNPTRRSNLSFLDNFDAVIEFMPSVQFSGIENKKIIKYLINYKKNFSQNVVNHNLQAIFTGKTPLYNDTDSQH